jgi:NO-binding membrane sensor protein with MHYT domain
MRKPPREVVITVVAVEAVLAAFAFRDLARRTDEQVRGPKLLWRVLIGLNPGNSLAYWAFGRRS